MGRPYGVEAACLARPATEASIALESLSNVGLEETPRHPSAGEDATLGKGLFSARGEVGGKIMSTGGMIKVRIRQLRSEARRTGGKRKVRTGEEEDRLDELGRETLNWRGRHGDHLATAE